MPRNYKNVKEKVKENLSGPERVALTCDAWTSWATQSYITITAHHIAEDWSLSSDFLQTRVMHESHTGSNVTELLCNVATEWDITEKDPALVSDNAANMVVAAKLAGLVHVKCYAHSQPGLSGCPTAAGCSKITQTSKVCTRLLLDDDHHVLLG